MRPFAIDRPDTRLAQRVASLQRPAGTVQGRPDGSHEAAGLPRGDGGWPGPDLDDGTGSGGVDLAAAVRARRSRRGHDDGGGELGLVYGAWDDNPVPLTEDAPLRPGRSPPRRSPCCELERVARETRCGATASPSPCCVPPCASTRVPETGAVGGATGASRWLERSLWHARSPGAEAGIDLRSSSTSTISRGRWSTHACARLDGAFNVAPPGWFSARRAGLELVGSPVGPLRVPGRMRRAVVGVRWRLGLGSTPPEVITYTDHPWVISSDRLLARAGRRPTPTKRRSCSATVRDGGRRSTPTSARRCRSGLWVSAWWPWRGRWWV